MLHRFNEVQRDRYIQTMQTDKILFLHLGVYSSSHEYGDTITKYPLVFKNSGTVSRKRMGDGRRHIRFDARTRSNLPNDGG